MEERGASEQALQRVHEQIATRIRADSTDKVRLTSLELISPLVPEPEKVRATLASMAATEGYRDVSLITTSHGDTYLYSDKAISRKEAERLAFDEEVRGQITDRVRRDSREKVALTPIDSLGAFIPGAERDRIDRHLLFLLDDERYADIHLVTDSRDVRYLYSVESMTRGYAEILAHAAANDPMATIADTVRDESRTYPRPTPLQTFEAPIFALNSAELVKHVEELVRRPEYDDIKMVKASTGATYLYSDLYLRQDWVQASVEWEEVGKYQNP